MVHPLHLNQSTPDWAERQVIIVVDSSGSKRFALTVVVPSLVGVSLSSLSCSSLGALAVIRTGAVFPSRNPLHSEGV